MSKNKIFRTANSAAMRLSAFITGNAQNIANVNDGEWYVIAPFGEFPSPDETYVQVLTREQAGKVVRTWNSIPGTAARMFKNMWHGLGAKFSAPVFDGHPETNKERWPVARLLAETTDLRVTANALEGKQIWNAKGMERRTRGPLYPSPLWWHLPPDDQRRVYPELLESIGLVPTPNIASVPAWTQNASPEALETNPKTKNNMDKNKLLKALGLGADATDDQILAAIEDRTRTANAAPDRKKLIEILGLKTEATNEEIANAIAGLKTTANAAPDRKTVLNIVGLKDDATNDELLNALRTAQSKAGTADTLTTANAALIEGVLDAFELAGKITPAQRAEVKAKFTGNANVGAVITELKNKKPEMNTKIIELAGTKIDVSTANARQHAIDNAILKKMGELKTEDRGVAFDAVKSDPQYKQLFEAMEATKKAAAA
jgi:hypothetical protein